MVWFYIHVVSHFQSSTFCTKEFYRSLSSETVCFASFKSRYFRTRLITEGCFCKNVIRCRFLFVLNPLLIWIRMRKLYFRAPDSEDMFVPMNVYRKREQSVKFYFMLKCKVSYKISNLYRKGLENCCRELQAYFALDERKYRNINIE